MATIAILGDSWGYPILADIPSTVYTPKKHTSNILKRLGHTVVNYAMGARSNRETWRLYEQSSSKTEWIVWFHTESFRDFSGSNGDAHQPFSIPQKRKQISEREYNKVNQTIYERGVKLIVIGGQAAVDPELLHLLKAELIIPDWRSELIGKSLPYTHQLCHPYLYESPSCIDSYEDRIHWTEQDLEVFESMKYSDFFPDDCHPGNLAHIELAQRIHNVIVGEIE